MASPQQRQLQLASAGRRAMLLLAMAALLPGAAEAKAVRGLRLPSSHGRGVGGGVTKLLSMRQAGREEPSATSFGPEGCVRLSRSNLGTCVIQVNCGASDVSQVDFSFVCINKASATKRAQHSYGVGGFESDEVFDSGVLCDSCTTVAYAQFSGGASVHNEVLQSGAGGIIPGAGQQPLASAGNLAKAPSPGGLAKAPSPGNLAMAPSPGNLAKAPSPGRRYRGIKEDLLPNAKAAPGRDETAFFGPGACIATYLSPHGTCMIRTRCRGIDLSSFAVGVTCIDTSGDYTRYLFGKNGFEAEELFDTTLKCKACVGVGDQPSYQLSGLVPKTMVEDLNSLKTELSTLRKEVSLMKSSLNASVAETSTNVSASGLAPAPSPAPSTTAAATSAKPTPTTTGVPAAGPSANTTANLTANATASSSPNATAQANSSAASTAPSPAASKASSSAASKTGQHLLSVSTELNAGEGDQQLKPRSVRDLLRQLVQKH